MHCPPLPCCRARTSHGARGADRAMREGAPPPGPPPSRQHEGPAQQQLLTRTRDPLGRRIIGYGSSALPAAAAADTTLGAEWQSHHQRSGVMVRTPHTAPHHDHGGHRGTTATHTAVAGGELPPPAAQQQQQLKGPTTQSAQQGQGQGQGGRCVKPHFASHR